MISAGILPAPMRISCKLHRRPIFLPPISRRLLHPSTPTDTGTRTSTPTTTPTIARSPTFTRPSIPTPTLMLTPTPTQTGTFPPTPTPTASQTPMPTCAPTGTPYCSDRCLPCPTIRLGSYAVPSGACIQNRSVAPARCASLGPQDRIVVPARPSPRALSRAWVTAAATGE